MSGFRSSAALPSQPSLARRDVARWSAFGGGSTSAAQDGYVVLTTLGTATGRNFGTTNLFTRSRRLGAVSSSSAGNFAGFRASTTLVTTGTGTAGLGGFYKVTRFGCSDAATVADARLFVGVSSSISNPTNVEPSTLTNCIGVGHDAGYTNLHIYYGGSSAQAPIDIGANFPVNTLSVDLYELVISAPSTSTDVYWQVTRLNTGHVATGSITNSGAVVLPAATTALSYMHAWRCNNATALAVGLDLLTDYVEMNV